MVMYLLYELYFDIIYSAYWLSPLRIWHMWSTIIGSFILWIINNHLTNAKHEEIILIVASIIIITIITVSVLINWLKQEKLTKKTAAIAIILHFLLLSIIFIFVIF